MRLFPFSSFNRVLLVFALGEIQMGIIACGLVRPRELAAADSPHQESAYGQGVIANLLRIEPVAK